MTAQYLPSLPFITILPTFAIDSASVRSAKMWKNNPHFIIHPSMSNMVIVSLKNSNKSFSKLTSPLLLGLNQSATMFRSRFYLPKLKIRTIQSTQQ
jgi:hypothetical protein